MEFREISAKEFDKFSSRHSQTSFSQTSSWGDLKKVNGWNSHFLGIFNNKKNCRGNASFIKTITNY